MCLPEPSSDNNQFKVLRTIYKYIFRSKQHFKEKKTHTLFPLKRPESIVFYDLSFKDDRANVTVHKCASIIRMKVLFEGGFLEEIW